MTAKPLILGAAALALATVAAAATDVEPRQNPPRRQAVRSYPPELLEPAPPLGEVAPVPSLGTILGFVGLGFFTNESYEGGYYPPRMRLFGDRRFYLRGPEADDERLRPRR